MVMTDREVRWLGRLGTVVAVMSALGLIALQIAAAPDATAAGETDSALTIHWNGDTSDAAEFQPQRNPESIHFGDLANVQVTVSKTKNLTDEVVGVTVRGMPGPTREVALQDFSRKPIGANFVQAMQCWGDPAAEDFYENCQFGAAGYGDSPQAKQVFLPGGVIGSPVNRGTEFTDVPFRAADKAVYSSLPLGVPALPDPKLPPPAPRVDELFSPTTSNEQLALVGNDGTASFGFEAQSAATAPHLNCGGSTTGGSNRCWLVIVPRGQHASDESRGCIQTIPGLDPDPVAQRNSPINPACDYWGNRIVVPLDFQPVRSACASGTAEVRLVGTELAATAMSSWQRQLCSKAKTAFTLNTVSDGLARDQLVAGQSTFVMTNRPVTTEGLDEEGAQEVRDAAIVYAPTTVSAVSIAFVAASDREVVTDIKLSPRLVAKLLTQSYASSGGGSFYREQNIPGWGAGPATLTADPEFRDLNPTLPAGLSTGQLIVTGPAGSDAISQVWAYLRADDQARAFLAGKPDNPGDPTSMRINPYYLPKGDPNAWVPQVADDPARPGNSLDPVSGQRKLVGLVKEDGSPMCLCDTPTDTIVKSDETQMPRELGFPNQTRYDSLQAWPYAENYHQAASMVFRIDTGSKTEWSDSAFIGANLPLGKYVANGLSLPWDFYLNGLIDSPTALHYQLNQAQLQLPNQRGVYARPDTSGMTQAVASATPTGTPGVSIVDPANLGAGAYPLTMITYSAVNLQKSTPELRASYASFLEYVATAGQAPGSAIGDLPAGYLPLDAAAVERTKAIAQTVRTYVPPPVGAEDDESFLDGTGSDDFLDVADVPVVAEAGSAAETVIATTDVEPGGNTENVANPVALALGGTLLLGLSGALGSPLLLRRRALA